MKTVWIVVTGVEQEGEIIHGVYASRKKARLRMNAIINKEYGKGSLSESTYTWRAADGFQYVQMQKHVVQK